jgi:hypothetical protein
MNGVGENDLGVGQILLFIKLLICVCLSDKMECGKEIPEYRESLPFIGSESESLVRMVINNKKKRNLHTRLSQLILRQLIGTWVS